MDVTCSFQVNATVVANDFIDRYMAAANGEYVKVYLYILRHQHEALDVGGIADALNHTESDVKRALLYWERLGALRTGTAREQTEYGAGGADRQSENRTEFGTERQDRGILPETMPGDKRTGPVSTGTVSTGLVSAGQVSGKDPASGKEAVYVETKKAETAASRPVYSQDQVNRLADDEDFTQLLYIAQKYMNKVFTPRECEVFAYLYDGLKMSAELLEYLVEYCVQGGHTSIRYIETVALSWHEKGLATVEEAKAYSSGFTKDSFAVMRAFGLSDRRPGDAEKEMIRRWFVTYGFGRELVLEACNRTLEATHSPSFRYADKILSEWKKAGVRSLQDVTVLDQKRQSQKTGKRGTKKQTNNQFHNFEQRNTDYDSMVIDQVKSWIGEA